MMQDYKNYRARPRLNKNRVASFLVGLVVIVALCVRLPEVAAEQSSHVATDCDGPVMSMPIDMGRVMT